MLLLLAGILSAGIWLWAIRRADRFEPEPFKSLLHVGLVGGFASVLASLVGNNLMIWWLGIDPESIEAGLPALSAALFSLFVGFNEEFWKAAFTLVLIRKMPGFDEPLDALIYGMAVALGFAALENIEYVGLGGMVTLVGRTLTAMPMHVGLAALWSTGLARARFGGSNRWVRFTWPYYVAAALLHAGYNLGLLLRPSGTQPLLLVAIVLLVGIVVLATRLVRRLDRASPFRPPNRCVACDRTSPPNARHCAHCGKELPGVPERSCCACRSGMPKHAVFCPACGIKQESPKQEEGTDPAPG